MTTRILEDSESGLILAAEECPPDKFERLHAFSNYDDVIIRKLCAHGPVLIRGGRGSGKSALLIESHRRMRDDEFVFAVYMSLRYLPLLQSDGEEYIGHFCKLLSKEIARELINQNIYVSFEVVEDEVALQTSLTKLAQTIHKRIVLFFDDAAHIGREKPLEVFFDLFRTLSSNVTSCKASIYPGVTKFGVRFDVFNDSTVLDISRATVSSFKSYFFDVLKARYPRLAERDVFSDNLMPEQFASLLGRAVVGNMRAFILACNRFDDQIRIGIPLISTCFLTMATDYYWPLMDEVAPKLGVYEPLIEPATRIFELIIEHVCRPIKSSTRSSAPDRIIIHRNIINSYSKIFEILEYLGFVSKIEASRGMKSGGRGPVFAINLCSLLEQIPTKRLTIEMIEDWVGSKPDLAEIHSSASTFSEVRVPALPAENSLGILAKPIDVLGKSKAYPYGITADKISRLKVAGIDTVKILAETPDEMLMQIDTVGEMTVRRMRNAMQQAIWM